MFYTDLIMLIEETTTYAYKLKYLENPSFDKVRNLAKKFIDELPKELVDDLYNSINRGVDILKTEPEMLVYLYSFGNMHQAKLNFAFDKIPEDFFSQPEINIIDYGCGQAIGTMCYADFLKSKNYKQQIKSVTLIEPSKICIKRAALHTSVFLPDAKIVTVNKTFDELAEDDLYCEENVPTLHILSNVLDLEFDLAKFAELEKGQLQGYNQFVCVGPYFGFSDKDRRMEDFAEFVGSNISFSKVFGKGEFYAGRNWTCQTVVASVGDVIKEIDYYKKRLLNRFEDKEHIINEIYAEAEKLFWKKNKCNEAICLYEMAACLGHANATQAYNKWRNYWFDGKYAYYRKDTNALCRNWSYYYDEYHIVEGTKIINDMAFCDLGSEIDYMYLDKVTIPASVLSIGYAPFNKYLSEIICNSPLFEIDNNTLYTKGKKRLIQCFAHTKSFIIPNEVEFIDNYAFYGCKSIQIFIPSSVKKMGINPFIEMDSDEGILEICSSSTKFKINNNALYEDETKLISYWGKDDTFVVPSGIKIIGEYTFFSSNLKAIHLPNTIESIGDCAFGWCFDLKQVLAPLECSSQYLKLMHNYKGMLYFEKEQDSKST